MSQQDSQTKTIDGHTFTVHMLDPFDAQDMLVDISQALGPALGGLAGAASSVLGSKKVDSLLDIELGDPKLASSLGSLFAGLEKRKLRELMQTMAEVTIYEGKEKSGRLQDVAKVVFAGNLPLMYKWFWFALQVNFENFFDWGQNAIKGALAKGEASPSQSTLPGIGRR